MSRVIPWKRQRPSAPIISGIYCSDIGVEYSNERMRAVNRKRIYPQASPETVELYEKLLSKRTGRRRKYVDDYEEIISRVDAPTKFERFRRSSLALMKDATEGLMRQLELTPRDFDVLIVNYMSGKTLPSLNALIANELQMRTDIFSLTLGDMGCSAAVAAIDLAARVLRSERKPLRALVLSLETVSALVQLEDDPGSVVGNTLFGEGCAAVCVSSHREPALYHIGHSQRTLLASDDGIDSITLDGRDSGPAIQLSKAIPEVAGEGIKINLKKLVPRIISPADKLRYLVTRKTPRWQSRIDHWAVHPGGIAVLKGLEKNLRLAPADLAPSYRVFMERSNMSSPSVLYAIENIEKASIKQGEKVLMMGFGSGFNVNSMVLTRGPKPYHKQTERWAVVIGGTSGIGLDAARMLTGRGYRVIIGSRRVGQQGADYEQLSNASYLQLDVTDPDSVAAFADAVWEQTYGVEVLVISSGVAGAAGAVGRQDPAEIQRIVSTNLTGALVAANALVPFVRQTGHVFLLNSILGQIPLMGSAAYCASKAGLRHFAEALEMELQRAGRNVNVHSLYPAYVKTPMLDQVQEDGAKTLLKPISPQRVTRAIERALDGRDRRGFVLPRDRALAGFYRLLPGAFKRLLSSL
jgi:predicted naringenin-chalcone synthase/NAD(P)-dependent dehydrogenase (short-subunit alcohol dehydrogenase family)